MRAGDWVEVRSKSEILRTLDGNGRLDELSFMPEMFQYCGRRFRVYRRAHKTCDTVNKTGGRRVSGAVHLENLRCDGQAHGGCQAACMIFWKTAWLKPVTPGYSACEAGPVVAGRLDSQGKTPSQDGCDEADVQRGTTVSNGATANDPTYSCQATHLPAFTTPLAWWDVRQYLEDYASGNVTASRMAAAFLYSGYNKVINAGLGLGSILRWLYDAFQKARGGFPYPRRRGRILRGSRTPGAVLNLQPGELVRVRSYQEILATLDEESKNRGLYFDAEEVPHCGKVFRVVSRVDRIINEQTGKMMRFKNPSVILEGAFCQSRYSEKRLFCPRSILAMWREIWLERVAAPTDGASTGTNIESAGAGLAKQPLAGQRR